MPLTVIHNCELSHHFCKACAKILAHARGVKVYQDDVFALLTRASKNKGTRKPALYVNESSSNIIQIPLCINARGNRFTGDFDMNRLTMP